MRRLLVLLHFPEMLGQIPAEVFPLVFLLLFHQKSLLPYFLYFRSGSLPLNLPFLPRLHFRSGFLPLNSRFLPHLRFRSDQLPQNLRFLLHLRFRSGRPLQSLLHFRPGYSQNPQVFIPPPPFSEELSEPCSSPLSFASAPSS